MTERPCHSSLDDLVLTGRWRQFPRQLSCNHLSDGKKYSIATVTGYVQAHLFIFREKSHGPPPHLATSALSAWVFSDVTVPPPQWLTKSSNEYKYVFVFHVVLFFPFFLPRWLTKSKFIDKCLFVYEVKSGQPLSNKLTQCLAVC